MKHFKSKLVFVFVLFFRVTWRRTCELARVCYSHWIAMEDTPSNKCHYCSFMTCVIPASFHNSSCHCIVSRATNTRVECRCNHQAHFVDKVLRATSWEFACTNSHNRIINAFLCKLIMRSDCTTNLIPLFNSTTLISRVATTLSPISYNLTSKYIAGLLPYLRLFHPLHNHNLKIFSNPVAIN